MTITVTEPTTLVASVSSTGIDCNGGSADVTVSATGGTAPYTGTGTLSETAGTYSYVVTDANGCSETVTITVTEPTALVASVSSTSIDCNGGTADITVSATGGTAPYTGTGTFSVTAGTYSYTVIDANGCTTTVNQTVVEPSPIVVSVTSSGVDCSTGNAYVTVSATGGTAPYTGTGVYCVTAGTYSYTVTDANGCSVTETITVAPCAPTYCQSYALCSGYEWINSVTIGSINNWSGNNGGYGDFTSMVTTASPGDAVYLQFTPGFSGQAYNEAWRIWVDWNNDGDFYDQGELIGQGYGSSTMSGWMTIPQYATLNTNLRVRVSMQWACNGYPDPCSIYNYGEVEDYTIIIEDNINGMQTVIGQASNVSDFKQGSELVNLKSSEGMSSNMPVDNSGFEIGNIYPNPVLSSNGRFNINVRAGSESDANVRIVDLSGKVLFTDVKHLEVGPNVVSLNVTGFPRGSYFVEVISGDNKQTTQLIVQ